MTVLITDPALRAMLESAQGPVDLVDPKGRVVGTYEPCAPAEPIIVQANAEPKHG